MYDGVTDTNLELLKEKGVAMLESKPEGQNPKLWQYPTSTACDTANVSLTTSNEECMSPFQNMAPRHVI